jgi:sugar lactone lactonase YvrE
MFNGVAVAKNGDIFFTHSSSEFGMEDGSYTFFINPSGRLVHFERKTGKVSVLLDKLWFANGVALSPNEDFIIVAETHASRVQRYWLKGDKKGQLEPFVEGLPGRFLKYLLQFKNSFIFFFLFKRNSRQHYT